ncbi:hypothetical protein Tco_0152014 [Tanacetum coccineum]
MDRRLSAQLNVESSDSQLRQIPLSRESKHGRKKQDNSNAFAPQGISSYVTQKVRIIVVTKVEIVEWQNYKHLDWIAVRRDDDILYKFKRRKSEWKYLPQTFWIQMNKAEYPKSYDSGNNQKIKTMRIIGAWRDLLVEDHTGVTYAASIQRTINLS